MAKTQKMLRKATDNSNKQIALLKDDVTFTANTESYEIFANKIVGVGGESQVYMARCIPDGSIVLAKIYTKFDKKNETMVRSRETIVNFLKSSADYKKTHLLPLYAAGEITIEHEQYPIDIIPNCPDGHLVQCSFEELSEKVIPGVLDALNYMHSSNLVHRDIKPENIYLFNDEVVLGDFGTSGRVSDYGIGGTQEARGTIGYTPFHEIGGGYYEKPTDYYAFGCTIATLYKGEHVYASLLKNGGNVLKAIKDNGLPLSCPDEHKSLQILVDALTMYDADDRANYDDVKLWIDNPNEFCKKWCNCRNQNTTSSFSYEFERNAYHTKEELTDAFLKSWETAKGDFYRGGTNNSRFYYFLVRANQKCVTDIGNILEERDQDKRGVFDLDLGFAKALHFFNLDYDKEGDSCPIYWCGYQFNSLSDISVMMSKDTACKDNLIHMLTSGFLSWKLRNTEDYDNEASVAVIEKIEAISKEYPNLAFYLLMYRLAPAGLFEIETPDVVFDKLISPSKSFFTNANTVFHDDNYLARLVSAGFEDQVLNFKRNLSTDYLKNVIELYRLFEAVCAQKSTVRKHFYSYGPYSYLYWIQQNLTLYSFNSDSAKRNAEQIRNITFSDETSIDELLRLCVNFKAGYYRNLLEDFQNDILLAYMGVETEKEISSNNIDAYFVNDFFGNSVPVGFMRYIGMDKPALSKYQDSSKTSVKKKTSAHVKTPVFFSAPTEQISVSILKVFGNRHEVIKVLQYYTGLDDDSASSALYKLPYVVKTCLTESVAHEMYRALQNAGALVSISRNT